MGFWTQVVDVPLQAPAGVATAFGGLPVHDGAAPQSVPGALGVWHAPLKHVSRVQGFESVAHGVPSVAFPCTQPLAGLHESVVHGSPSSQLSAVPPEQTELELQVVPTVQALPSSQGFPVSG
jgi:hypothetical protein